MSGEVWRYQKKKSILFVTLGPEQYNAEFLQENYLFRWSYLSQYLTYSIVFWHLDIREDIEEFQK